MICNKDKILYYYQDFEICFSQQWGLEKKNLPRWDLIVWKEYIDFFENIQLSN